VDFDVDLNNLTYVEYDTGARELYDLESDPDELRNVHSNADPRVAELSRWVGALRTASGQGIRDAEQTPP